MFILLYVHLLVGQTNNTRGWGGNLYTRLEIEVEWALSRGGGKLGGSLSTVPFLSIQRGQLNKT
jgi:hypothetical protein